MNPSQMEPKFCKDCVHLLGNRNYKDNWETWKCDKTKAVTGLNLVTGEIVYSASFCDNVRKGVEFCGPEGKWYEEYKQPQFLEPDISIARKSSKHLSESDLTNL